MTQESTTNKPEIIDVEVTGVDGKPLSFKDKARALLSESDYTDLMAYVDGKKPELALSTANSFFELYMNGVDVDSIHSLNAAFPKSAINWCRIKYDWDHMLKEHIHKLQSRIADKVMKAQLEATALYADIITAANKKHSINLRKYIQTGDESYLKKTMDINSVHQLQKAVEGLQKVTNQDKNFTLTSKEDVNVSIDVNDSSSGSMSAETATKILAAVAEEKRKKALGKK
jgi:hypothetical protein